MSKPANTSLIGIFIFGGTLLLIVAIGIFGSSQFNSERHRFICFFEDSVNGLDVGSPVKFKGVTIGRVANVLLRIENQSESEISIPVIIEIDEKLLASRGILTHLEEDLHRSAIIETGLRARLQQLSIITGMLYIEMDIYPHSELVFRKGNSSEGLQEIPTIPSNLGTVMRAATQTLEQISQVDYVGIGEKVQRILDQLQAGVGEIEFKQINQGVLTVSDSAQTLLNNPDIRETAANLNGALQEFQMLSAKLAREITPLSTELSATATAAQQALDKLDQAAENLRIATQPGTGLRSELDETLQQLADAARAVRTLAGYLERNPNAIITGKAQDDTATAPEQKK